MKLVATIAAVVFTSAVFAKTNLNPSGFFTSGAMGAEVNLEALEQALNLDGKAPPPPGRPGTHPCGQVDLTDTQKEALKKAFVAFKRASIQDKADLDIAKLDYFTTLADASSTKSATTATSDIMATAVGDMVKSHLNFVNNVVFDILTVDQREPALHCMAWMHHAGEMMKLKKACDKHFPGNPAPRPAPPTVN